MKYFITIAAALSLSACATSPENIRPAYISDTRFDGMSCEQLSGRAAELTQQRDELAKRIDRRRRSDSIMVGVGAVVAWPALFFIKGNGDVKRQYAELQGEYNAVQTATLRECGR